MSILDLHLFAATFWFGLLAMETVMELHANTPARREVIARIHAWSDPIFELPAVSVLLATGLILLTRSWPPTPLLLAKVALGGTAILINYWCYSFVIKRARHTTADTERIRLTRNIALTGLAIPPAMAAFVIGMFYLR
jgi:hypothetical protein